MPPELNLIKLTTEQILSNPTWDIILIFALLAAGFFYGLTAGKRRIAATLLYTYVSFAVSSAIPIDLWFDSLSAMDKFFVKGGTFLALFLTLSFFLRSSHSKGFAPASSWWQIFLLGLMQAGLLIHIVLGFLSPEKAKLLAPLTRNFFANPDLRLWWLLGPLAILIFIRWFEWKEEKKW